MTKNLPIVYEGHELSILVDDDKLVNLTDIWKAQGSPKFQKPYDWERTDQAKRFIESLRADPKSGRNLLWKIKRGRHGGTYAHWPTLPALAHNVWLPQSRWEQFFMIK